MQQPDLLNPSESPAQDTTREASSSSLPWIRSTLCKLVRLFRRIGHLLQNAYSAVRQQSLKFGDYIIPRVLRGILWLQTSCRIAAQVHSSLIDAFFTWTDRLIRRTLRALLVVIILIAPVSYLSPAQGWFLFNWLAIVFPGTLIGVWFPTRRDRATSFLQKHSGRILGFISFLVTVVSFRYGFALWEWTNSLSSVLAVLLWPYLIWTGVGSFLFYVMPDSWPRLRGWIATFTLVSAVLAGLFLFLLLLTASQF